MDLGLADAAVVVTGGSKGMGRAGRARRFAAEGARVAVLARGRDGARRHGRDARTPPGSPDASASRADLTVRDEVDAAFAEIGDAVGRAATCS